MTVQSHTAVIQKLYICQSTRVYRYSKTIIKNHSQAPKLRNLYFGEHNSEKELISPCLYQVSVTNNKSNLWVKIQIFLDMEPQLLMWLGRRGDSCVQTGGCCGEAVTSDLGEDSLSVQGKEDLQNVWPQHPSRSYNGKRRSLSGIKALAPQWSGEPSKHR